MKFIQDYGQFIEVECKSCGKKHTVQKGNYTKSSYGFDLTPTVRCSCGNVGIAAEDRKQKRKNSLFMVRMLLTLGGILGIIIFALIKLVGLFSNTGYEYKEFKDITKKEYEQFMEWDAKQQEKKQDNEKMFGE